MHSGNDQRDRSMRPTFRSRLRWIYISILQYSGLLALAKWWVRWHGAVVLTFHRILADEAMEQTCSPEGLVMRESTFQSLLTFVNNHYSVFSAESGFPADTAKRVPVAITFDDGWEDNASTAFPIAKALEIPFTIFVCTELMDKAEPFWPEKIVSLFRTVGDSTEASEPVARALKSCGYPELTAAVASANADRCDVLIGQLKAIPSEERRRILHSLLVCRSSDTRNTDGTVDRTMSWVQASELLQGGVSFGSHTQNHEILTTVPLAQMEQEIRDSKTAIEERMGACTTFSYPNGSFSPEVREIVARSGYKRAFINSPGIWRQEDDPFLIPRINLSEQTVTGPDGQFSALAFEYRVFWNAFVHGTRQAAQVLPTPTVPVDATVEKINTV